MTIQNRGERLRKREEERAIKRANKRRKLGKKPLEVDKSGGHEGRVKKHANKRRLEVRRDILLCVVAGVGGIVSHEPIALRWHLQS